MTYLASSSPIFTIARHLWVVRRWAGQLRCVSISCVFQWQSPQGNGIFPPTECRTPNEGMKVRCTCLKVRSFEFSFHTSHCLVIFRFELHIRSLFLISLVIKGGRRGRVIMKSAGKEVPNKRSSSIWRVCKTINWLLVNYIRRSMFTVHVSSFAGCAYSTILLSRRLSDFDFDLLAEMPACLVIYQSDSLTALSLWKTANRMNWGDVR